MKIADDFELDGRVFKDLYQVHQELGAAGKLPSQERLDQYYETFREKFGPDTLAAHDGQALLSLMQETTRDAMIYWLEFKDDEEFPSVFGSIAGGSALKYGFYRRTETREWTTGTTRAQRPIKPAEAVELARRNRDQLVAASKLLTELPPGAANGDYLELQRQLERLAPHVQNTSWGHKYLSLIHPDKLANFHAVSHQRFHLAKLLHEPSRREGRYINESLFVSLSRALNCPLNNVMVVLLRRNGVPYRYWKVGTRDGDTKTSYWDRLRRESVVAVGWSKLGDLSAMLEEQGFHQSIKARLAELYPALPAVIGNSARKLTNFCKKIADRDIVLACDGKRVLGIGQISGAYRYKLGEVFPHERPVKWVELDEWQLPTTEGLQTTVHEYRKHFDNWVAIERRVLKPVSPLPPRPGPGPPIRRKWAEGGMIGRIQNLLDRKGQAILYGPPGTGKTYWAELAVRNLAALGNYGVEFDKLLPEQRERVIGQKRDSFVRACTFHPSYGYEDFIEGFRPEAAAGSLAFSIQEGIFKTMCRLASDDPGSRYFLVIDEINRGDIPRIFGELLTLLDKPKRGSSVLLPLSGDSFAVPENVFVVGTMNTADRSIALLDTALRRRFGFIELMPDPGTLGDTVIEGIALRPWLSALNQQVTAHVGRDGRNLQVGHSYFMSAGRPIQEFRHFARVIEEDVLPLLEEYCYDDWEALERILGSGLVDIANHRFKAHLFEPAQQTELVRAILAVTPDVSASDPAVRAEASAESEADESDNAEAEGDS